MVPVQQYLKCPKCATVVQKPASGSPVCGKCGYGGPPRQAAPQPTQVFTWPTPPQPAPAPLTFAPLPSSSPPVPNRLRPVSIGKTIGFSLITFGIYYLVQVFKESGDLHRMQGGWPSWKAFFWMGLLIPFAGAIFMFVLYFKNNKQANALRQQRGLEASYLPFILLFIPLANIAAPFVWASHYNAVAART